MNTVRYIMAVFVLVGVIPAFAFWVLIHPLIGFWRKLGPTATYAIVALVMVLMGIGIYQIRELLLVVDLGTNMALWPAAVVGYVVAVRLTLQCRKHLKFRILVGLPEVVPDQLGGNLLTEGIYAKLRHPRYVAVLLGLAAWAFFINYLGVYLLTLASVPAVYVIVLFEERELLARFGDEYEGYRNSVPRFIPRRMSFGRLLRDGD